MPRRDTEKLESGVFSDDELGKLSEKERMKEMSISELLDEIRVLTQDKTSHYDGISWNNYWAGRIGYNEYDPCEFLKEQSHYREPDATIVDVGTLFPFNKIFRSDYTAGHITDDAERREIILKTFEIIGELYQRESFWRSASEENARYFLETFDYLMGFFNKYPDATFPLRFEIFTRHYRGNMIGATAEHDAVYGFPSLELGRQFCEHMSTLPWKAQHVGYEGVGDVRDGKILLNREINYLMLTFLRHEDQRLLSEMIAADPEVKLLATFDAQSLLRENMQLYSEDDERRIRVWA